MEIKKDALGNAYYVHNGIVVEKKYADEAYLQSLKDSEAYYQLLDEVGGDYLDLDLPVSIAVFGGSDSIRNAKIIEDKGYLDEAKQVSRYSYNEKIEDNIRNEAVILLNDNENRLSEVITQLPYGLIDKQATGIGATHLELHCSKRNSIIVVPTRALGESKCGNNLNFIYVGTQKIANRVTTDEEIRNYLNNSNIEYKKIVVVADSLYRVIRAITNMGRDVYREYFLMVDEIDTIQSDNHFRPQLSNVIDYYYRFKLQRRALVSATVKEFSDPKLQKEPLTTIRRKEPLKRNLTLLYTNNINELLIEEIIKIYTDNTTDKILIAYNSISEIQMVINRLPENIKNRCGILCSETSHSDGRIEEYQIAEINNDELSHHIVFMTCAYFAGIDIKNRCHLITVSTTQYNYTILSVNRMTQIAGRCRNGLISDTIIYDIIKNRDDRPFYYQENYKDELINKADKIVKYFTTTEALAQGDEDLEAVFNRIEPVIIENTYQKTFRSQSIPITRKNFLDKRFEISYFNIDVLYEQMCNYSLLYSNKNNLFNYLNQDQNIISRNDKLYEQTIQEAST